VTTIVTIAGRISWAEAGNAAHHNAIGINHARRRRQSSAVLCFVAIRHRLVILDVSKAKIA
jgi:hypothetical protein